MDGMLPKPLQTQAIRRLLALWCDLDNEEDGQAMTPEQEYGQDLDRLFLQTTRNDLAALEQASLQGDRGRMVQLAHRMKGAALTMGRLELVALLDCVEEALRAEADGQAAISLLLQSLASALQARSLQA